MGEAARSSLDPKVRFAKYQEMLDLFEEEAPGTVLFRTREYYGVRSNSDCLELVHYTVERAWHYWLNRRGGRKLTWKHYGRLTARYPLPRPRIVQAGV